MRIPHTTLFLWWVLTKKNKATHTSIAHIQTILPIAMVPGGSAGGTPGLIDEDEVARMAIVGLLTQRQMVETPAR